MVEPLTAEGLRFDLVRVGQDLPGLIEGPIVRRTLALYCGASGDHNPIHVDIDFARSHGHEDVFAHGMLSMAYLGRLLTRWAPVSALRGFRVRFTAVTRVHDVVTCSARVVEKIETESEKQVRVELRATTTDGTETLIGEAVLALP
jgi:acyl dehydratase